LRVHFGLGRSNLIERIEVRWPNGLEEEWKNLEVDRILTLTEGSGATTTAGK
jgi:enediyne biosynthesis protein E4